MKTFEFPRTLVGRGRRTRRTPLDCGSLGEVALPTDVRSRVSEPSKHFASLRLCVRCAAIIVLILVSAANAFAGFIEMKDGYFWDPDEGEYWVPHGFAYQTINPPVGATQSHAQIDYDFLEMKKMHADSLRVDFTWGYLEPTDNGFDWTDTDYIIERAEEYGLRLFCLIGYQYPPSWFSNDWMAVNQSNQYDNVLNYSHPMARAAYTDFIAQITARYKDSPAVAGWILGNEFAYFDLWANGESVHMTKLFLGYDTNYSLPDFRNFVSNQYAGSIAALNANWGTAYADFGDVSMPTNYPGCYDPGNVDKQNRYYPAYHDLIQWRKQSIGDFIALGADAAKNADTNHLISYSMVGGIYNGFDANNTCEDAKTIVARCQAAGAPLDFWSINNYAWCQTGNELRSGQFGITKYQEQSGLPVLITETGHTSTDDIFPETASRYDEALPGQIWEAVMAGALGAHIFTWNDRKAPSLSTREEGFGIVKEKRKSKGSVYWNVREMFRRMEEVDVHSLFGGSQNPDPDIYFYWSSDADMVWPRANQENAMLWGGLKRVGLEPGFLDEDGYDAGAYTNVQALLLSHAFMMQSNRVLALTNVIADGVHVHANGFVPGRYDPYHKENPGWAQTISDVFGLSVGTATSFWHGGISGGSWEQPYTGVNLDYLTTLGPLNPSYTWTNVATWIRQANITANSGTTVVNCAYDYYGLRTLPALQIKGHDDDGKAAINTWTLGDSVNMWWLNPVGDNMPWDLHYDWGHAIYVDWFGIEPAVYISTTSTAYVIPDYRICANGSVLISFLNESTAPANITITASNLLEGKVVEQISAMYGVLQTNSPGHIDLTLGGDEYLLLYAYTEGSSLINTSRYKVWIESEPLTVWPNGEGEEVEVGYDTRGDTLDIFVALEARHASFKEYGRTNAAGVSGQGVETLLLNAPDADLQDADYISTRDGGDYVYHVWLEDSGAVVSESYLGARLAWGARPSSLPATITTGQTYDITVNWQELRSYKNSETPTPLSRADVWEPSLADDEAYTVYLELMTGDVVVASHSTSTSTGTDSNEFSVTVPGLAGPFAWRARTVGGANHDVFDSFEDRPRTQTGSEIDPWVEFSYAETHSPALLTVGVHDTASAGTNGALMEVQTFADAGSYSGFGMSREYGTAWELPDTNEWSSIIFSFDFLETNGYTGTLEMKLEDSSGGALSYTQPYTGTAWSNVSASLDQFSVAAWPGTFDPNNAKKLVILLQTTQLGVTYLATFDNISLSGTPLEVPEPGNDDFVDSFEDRTLGQFQPVSPWTLSSCGSGGEFYQNNGFDSEASNGSKGSWYVYWSHTAPAGTSTFFISYIWADAISVETPSNIVVGYDFYEDNFRDATLEIQVRDSGGGMSSYSEPYDGTKWDTIETTLDQFTGDLDTSDIKELQCRIHMEEYNTQYVGHIDFVRFTGTVASAISSATNGLYLSINDSSAGADTDGDGILDIYETDTDVYVDPTNTGTDPNDPDSDDDGLNDGDEVIAGSDPNNVNDTFEADDVTNDPSGFVVRWFARTNRIYAVHYCDGAFDPSGFGPLGSFTNITVNADGDTNVVDATAGTATSRFYRVQVRTE